MKDRRPPVRPSQHAAPPTGSLLTALNTIEDLHDGFVTIDRDWRFSCVNERAALDLGRPVAELVGADMWQLFPEIRGTQQEAVLRRVMEERVALSIELQPPGQPHSYRMAVFPSAGGITVVMTDITARKRDAEALRRSEERFAKAFHGTTAPMALSTLREGIYVDVNEAWSGATGYAREQVLGRSANELGLWSDPQDREALVRSLERDGVVRNLECRIRTAAGAKRTVLVSSQLIELSGEPVIVSFLADVTERLAAETALRRSEEKFAKAFQGSVAGMAITDLESGTFIDVNTAWSAATGFARDAAVGKTSTELGIWLQPEARREFVAQLQRSGFVSNLECAFRRADGRDWTGLVSAQTIEIDGRPALVSSIFDVTAERRAAAALRESESFYRQTLESIPGMVFTTRPDGYCDYQSQQWVDYTGVPMAEHLGDGWNRLLHPEDRAAALAAWRDATAGRAPYDLEYRVRRHDGVYEWFRVVARPLRDSAGKVVRWFGVTMNIQELKSANARLLAEDRRKNEFLAVLSHELRNPLAPIRNSLYVLEHVAPGGEQALRAREVIDRQTSQLTRLVDDLLDVTRITQGKVRLRRELVDLGALARRCAEDHRPAFTEAGVAFRVTVCDEPAFVRGDSARLAQVVGNLLSNAVKFTEAGGRTELRLDLLDGTVRLSVSDTGVGIPPAMLEQMFEPFVQAEHTLDRSQGGLGLGLAVLKGLVDLHGGTVTAHSEGPGKGTEFVVSLRAATEPARGPALSRAETASRRCLRVLVIEDNLDAADSLRAVLELHGHEVATACAGPQGLELARALKPDLVLCDIGLPGMDGFEVARALRAERALAGTRLVALSGYGQPEDVQKARASGFDGHLTKPVDPDVLAALLTPTRN